MADPLDVLANFFPSPKAVFCPGLEWHESMDEAAIMKEVVALVCEVVATPTEPNKPKQFPISGWVHDYFMYLNGHHRDERGREQICMYDFRVTNIAKLQAMLAANQMVRISPDVGFLTFTAYLLDLGNIQVGDTITPLHKGYVIQRQKTWEVPLPAPTYFFVPVR